MLVLWCVDLRSRNKKKRKVLERLTGKKMHTPIGEKLFMVAMVFLILGSFWFFMWMMMFMGIIFL